MYTPDEYTHGTWELYEQSETSTTYDLDLEDHYTLTIWDDHTAILRVRGITGNFKGTWTEGVAPVIKPTYTTASTIKSDDLPSPSVLVTLKTSTGSIVQITLDSDGSADMRTFGEDAERNIGTWELFRQTSTTRLYVLDGCTATEFRLMLDNDGDAMGEMLLSQYHGSWRGQ